MNEADPGWPDKQYDGVKVLISLGSCNLSASIKKDFELTDGISHGAMYSSTAHCPTLSSNFKEPHIRQQGPNADGARSPLTMLDQSTCRWVLQWITCQCLDMIDKPPYRGRYHDGIGENSEVGIMFSAFQYFGTYSEVGKSRILMYT